MARELSIDLEVNPTLNTQATRNLINTLEKEIRTVKSGQHLSLAKKASSVMQNWVASGVASTPTQARMILSDMMGGGFTAQQKAVLRSAQNITSAQLYFQKANRLERQRIGAVSARAAYLQNQYQAFQHQPSSEVAAGLLVGLTGIRRELLKLYQEYRVNRRQVPPILRQIAQNTSSMKRDVSDWDNAQEKPSAGGNFLLAFTKKIAGVASIASVAALVFKKGVQGITSALQRGAQAMRLQAAYGNQVNWGDVRARAGIFNMSEETAVAPSEYAADFRQRMMWGEISEREVIGLSRAGRWGRMVMSGEAARNPALANQVFENMVATTDRSKMRSILRQLGLPQDLMQYNIQGYDRATREEYNQKFAEIAEKEWQAAVMMYDAGNQYQVFSEQLSSLLSQLAGEGVQYASPQGREFARRLGVNVVTENDVATARDKVRDSMIRNASGMGPLYDVGKMFIDAMQQNKNISQNVNNNITINGNVDMDNVDSITEKMSAELAKSNYDMVANAIGARTSF